MFKVGETYVWKITGSKFTVRYVGEQKAFVEYQVKGRHWREDAIPLSDYSHCYKDQSNIENIYNFIRISK